VPALTVRAFAELLSLPAYEYLRILHEQKYPRQQPQVFRTPFYLPALSGIRQYYRSGNDRAALVPARQAIALLGLESRREHNTRVLDQFERSTQSSVSCSWLVTRGVLPPSDKSSCDCRSTCWETSISGRRLSTTIVAPLS